MAQPNFNTNGDITQTAEDIFVNKILNGKNDMVEEDFARHVIGVFNFEAEQLDKSYQQAKQSNENIKSDDGAKENFDIAYNQLLNKAQAECMGKLAERVCKLSTKLNDPEQCYQDIPSNDLLGVTMEDSKVSKRYKDQYQDLFKGRITGHQVLQGKKLTIKVQQKQLFKKLDKEFDSSDEDDFDYFTFSDAKMNQIKDLKKKERSRIFNDPLERENLIINLAKQHNGVYPDDYYQYWLQQFAQAKDKSIRRPYNDRLLIELENNDDKKLTFEFIEGDICDHGQDSINGEILVNITDSNLTLNNGVSRKLNEGAGYTDILENGKKRKVFNLYKYATEWLEQNSYVEQGGIAFTESGGLYGQRNTHYMIHTTSVGPYRHPHERSRFWLKRQITNILMTAKELQVKSIVMPLLGVGDSNFPVDVVVEVISKTIMEFHSVDSEETKKKNVKGLWGKSTKLENVTIVIWKKPNDENEKTNPTLLHFPSAKEKFDIICQSYGLQ